LSASEQDRLQDAFRARVLFPIFSDTGEAVAIGGRVLPGSDDPAKYKNSPETPIYAKSRTLYGLNWAKAEISTSDQVVVCEGYTDVIGFHRAGVARAVATCGTAFTEDHVRLLKRYANRVVLAFDADAAGQGAAERFYEWEAKYEVDVYVADLPRGADPGDLAQSNPEALRQSVAGAKRFLQFLTLGEAKRMLAESKSVLEASLEVGLSGPGRLHESSARRPWPRLRDPGPRRRPAARRGCRRARPSRAVRS